ncbi:MAG: 4Fe-4S binding protein [Chloroflexi bacterium]|nr:4Fe-4S binding protein [Chloroflexota bacterium]
MDEQQDDPGRERVLLLLCQSLAASGLDLGEVSTALQRRFPDLKVALVPDLCHGPQAIQDAVGPVGASRLVLGACGIPDQAREFRRAARRAGLDPFGVQIVDLRHHCALVHPRHEATEKAKLLLAAAVEGVQAFGGTTPENLKSERLSPDQPISRRSLLSLPAARYTIVPRVVPTSCAAGRGCVLCVQACPKAALVKGPGGISLQKERCVGCGLCAATCPTGAVEFPGHSGAELAAEVQALLTFPSADLGPRAIVFTCSKSEALLTSLGRRGLSYPPNVLPVALPCLAMATPWLLLLPVYLGAAAVRLLSCGQECRAGVGPLTERRLAFLGGLLASMSFPKETLRTLTASDAEGLRAELEALGRVTEQPASVPGTPARAALPRSFATLAVALATQQNLDDGCLIADPDAPLGIVHIEPEVCTACGLCAVHCPTGALALTEGEEVALSFDAALCVGCAACDQVCPERERGAIAVRRAVDLRALREGRQVRIADQPVRCAICGKSFVTQRMVRRVQAELERMGRHVPDAVLRCCPDCRVTVHLRASPRT